MLFNLFFLLIYAPNITLSALQLSDGPLEIRGSGFTPGRVVYSHLLKPDRTEHPIVSLRADDRGAASHTIDTVLLLSGTYELWWADVTSGATSNRVRFTVGFENDVPALPEVQEAIARYAGTWRSSTILVGLTGKTGTTAGTVAYTELSCGGVLRFRLISKDAIQVSESITYGIERCPTNALARLEITPDGRLAYHGRREDKLAPVKELVH